METNGPQETVADDEKGRKKTVPFFDRVAVRRTTAADMLDCSPSTIYNLCRAGKLKTIRLGADERILVESIKAFGRGQ